MLVSTSLTDAILAFVNDSDWSARKQVVQRYRELLLGHEVESLLEAAIANNRRAGTVFVPSGSVATVTDGRQGSELVRQH
jgi:hypothetical protein